VSLTKPDYSQCRQSRAKGAGYEWRIPSSPLTRSRELENEGLVEVRYERGCALYRAKQVLTLVEMARKSAMWFDSLPGETIPRQKIES